MHAPGHLPKHQGSRPFTACSIQEYLQRVSPSARILMVPRNCSSAICYWKASPD